MAVPRLPPLPTIKDLLKLYKLNAVKKLSQNFILDERITDKIVKRAGKITGMEVLEVGPGPGALTRSIIKKCPKKVVVVEKDYRFKPTLDMLAEAFTGMDSEMVIIFGDIMRVKMSNVFMDCEKKLWNDKPPNIHVIGNLPFSVSTHLIIQWLEAIANQSDIWSYGRTKLTLTFQKEVAERLVAQASDTQRCRLSVMAQAWTFPVLRFIIPGSAFVPKPDVDVGVVTFMPLVQPRTQHNFKFFEKVTRHIFSFRQKYCIRCIETLFPPEQRAELAAMTCKLADIDPTMRPIQLMVEDIDRLASAYEYLVKKHPDIRVYDYRASRRVLKPKYTLNVNVEDHIQ